MRSTLIDRIIHETPFSGALNPHTESIALCLEAATAEAGPMTVRWRSHHYDELVGRMYPTAAASHLSVIAECVLWLFVADDRLDPGGPVDGRLQRQLLRRRAREVLALQSSTPEDDPIVTAVERITRQLRPLAGPVLWQQFSDDMMTFLDAICAEADGRSVGTPVFSDYVRSRRITSGWGLLTDLIELDGAVRDSSSWERVRWAAADVAWVINDLVSHEKETIAGEKHNLVFILQQERGHGIEAAIEDTLSWLSGRVTAFSEARREFLASMPNKADLHYVNSLEQLIKGSLDWSLITRRYKTAGASSPGGAQCA